MLLAVSLMFPYLLGLGSLLLILCGGRNDLLDDDSDRLQLLGTLLVFGILVNHLAVLSLPTLGQSLLVGIILSLTGFATLVLSHRKQELESADIQERRRMGSIGAGGYPIPTPALPLKGRGHSTSLLRSSNEKREPGYPIATRTLTLKGRGLLLLFPAVYIGCLIFVLVEPIDGWDARAIWFFHAKMIFYSSSLDPAVYWSAPYLPVHPDYPNLVPFLAAQVAYVAGYWNEYLPKLSLVALLVPALLCLISILRRKWWQMVLIAVPLLFILQWLKNGYMDGYLALYAGMAAFFLGRWLDKGGRLDLVSGILLVGVVLDLKNEGMLFALIAGSLIVLFVLFGNSAARSAVRITVRIDTLTVFALSISGALLWGWKKHLAHVHNDLQLGLGSLGRISQRLSEGALSRIVKHLYFVDDLNLSFGILLLCLVCALSLRIRPRAGFYFCAAAPFCYFCGIVLVYLGTPHDLYAFQLPTGDRTMLPVHLMLLAASFSLFRKDRSEAS